MGKIEFNAVFDGGQWKLPDAFYGIKKYCSWPQLFHLQFVKIHVITLLIKRANLNYNFLIIAFFQLQILTFKLEL